MGRRQHSFTEDDIDDILDSIALRRDGSEACSHTASSVEPFPRPDHKAKRHPRPMRIRHSRRQIREMAA